MNPASPFMTFDKTGEDSMCWTIQQLENAGFQVVRTFVLQADSLSHSDCRCPHHGSKACNCQMSVLLVYKDTQTPASLLLHSYQETTWLYLVDTPEQHVDQNLGSLIQGALNQAVPGSIVKRE